MTSISSEQNPDCEISCAERFFFETRLELALNEVRHWKAKIEENMHNHNWTSGSDALEELKFSITVAKNAKKKFDLFIVESNANANDAASNAYITATQ